jgi:hypothetical protein
MVLKVVLKKPIEKSPDVDFSEMIPEMVLKVVLKNYPP